MTTPRDLIIISMDVVPSRPVTQGDLSLALAGAEVIDLLGAEAAALDGDRLVPRLAPAFPDPLLDAAAAALIRTSPYETVEDWLWRRGRGLAAAYLAALERDQVVTRRPGSWTHLKAGQQVLADTAARRDAAERWACAEPVLAALARAVGIRGELVGSAPEEEAGTPPETAGATPGGGEDVAGDASAGPSGDASGTAVGDAAGAVPGVAGEAVTTVLATVNDAVMELEAVRQRRAIEKAAFDNVWRGFG